MEYTKTINNLLVRCSEMYASTCRQMLRTNPEYIQFETELKRFLTCFSLECSPEGKRISEALPHIPGQILVNENVQEIAKSLISLRGKPRKEKVSFDRIFISHSKADIAYVSPFVALLETLGLDKRTMFCSSVQGYGIPLREDIFDYLKREFTDKNILVVIMLSDNYYKSVPCVSEMGATWVMSKDYQPVLLREFDFTQIKGPANPHKISFKITDMERLDEFKKQLIEELKLSSIDEAKWSRAKMQFLNSISSL